MIALFVSAFVTLFVVLDPPGCVPIFSSLTSGGGAGYRRSMAWRSTAIAAGVLLLFGLFGEDFLTTLGITLPAFKLAGGIMVFLIAIDMVFETRTQRREERANSVSRATEEPTDISVFPMAIPMIAGPGSIAAVMLLMAKARGLEASLTVLAALGAVLLVMLGALLAAGPLMRLMGDKIEAMITRLLGVILAALAAQFVIDGIRESFHLA
ncbi:MarC family protein [Glacieibacterium sp.]|uniref:MarC family protein n=1 Tax=Glacieibacterium sp. TaxID=2860237 RepID=UPI003B000BA0